MKDSPEQSSGTEPAAPARKTAPASADSGFFRCRRALVTGGAGLIGSAFIAELLRLGAEVHTVAHRRLLPGEADVRITTGDLRSLDVCRRAASRMDFVIHAAGVSGGSKRAAAEPIQMFTDNLVMNTQMIEAARLENVGYYLFISNSSVYASSDAPLREESAWGDTPMGPPENYTGVVKRAGEAQCALYARHTDTRFAIMRAANAYGPNDSFDPDSSHVVGALIRKAVSRQNPFTLWGDGTAVRDFVHSADVARAGLLLLQCSTAAACVPVNIGTGRLVSIEELAAITLELTGHSQAELRHDLSAPPASRRKVIDVSRMKALGFEPSITLEAGLHDTIEWYRSHAVHRDL